MPYPEHLLPKPTYSIIQWRNELRNYHLLRSTPTVEVLDPETGKVRARWFNEINREQFKDYSTNLFGVFTAQDAAIVWAKNERKSYLTGYWSEGEQIEPPTEDDFTISETSGCYFFPIDALQGFPQPISVASQPAYTEARCHVAHTPTRANFWHFSVRWKVGEADVAEVFDEKERRNLLGLVRAFLLEHAVGVLPEGALGAVPEGWYKMRV